VKLEAQRVDAHAMGLAFATDRDLELPARPRFVAELVAVPLEDGVLYVGGEQPQVLRGRSARPVLDRVVPLLDGTRTLAEIAAEVPGLAPEQVRDIVSLLRSRGLLEDGAPAPRTDRLAEVGAFLGRFVDVSRVNADRDAALARLAATSVGVCGPAALVGRAAAALAASGVRDVRAAVDDAEVNLVISTGIEPRRARTGTRTLLVRLGAAEAQLGPMLVPGVTACPACLERVHPHPSGAPDDLLAAYWIGLAVTQLTLAISRIVVSGHPRGFQVVRQHGGEVERLGRVATPIPGCADCGLDGPAVAPDDPALVPWIYHAATALPGREFVSPRAHQMHYAVGNLELAQEERPPLLGAPLVALPAPAVDGAPPWVDSRVTARPVTVADVATLLGRVGGYLERGGAPRRIAPTGGNLGSVDLWVVARAVDGLARGVYHYDAPRHRLETVAAAVDDAALAAALRTDAVPDVAIVTTGALARCAQKYGAFTYRLVHLDSGVALAYAHAVAGALGVAAREIDALDEVGAAALLGLHARWDSPIPTAAFGLGAWHPVVPASARQTPPSPPLGAHDHADDVLARLLVEASSPPPPPAPAATTARVATAAPRPRWAARGSLDAILLARRAVRAWDERAPSGPLLRALLAEVSGFLLARVAAGAPPCFVRPVLAVARAGEGVEPGLYEHETGELVRLADFDLAAMRACTNQEGLALSPAALFLVADLAAAVAARGARGYREAAQHAGAAVGHAWLVATGAGLGGTAAGGVLAGGLRAVAGFDPRRRCPLLAFHVGWPARSAAVEA